MRRAAVIACAGIVAALAALQAARAQPQISHAGASALGAGALLVPGLIAMAVGVEARRRRPRDHYGTVLALAGAASFLPELAGPGARSPAAFTAGLVLGWASPPLIAHVALTYPGGRATRRTRTAVGLGYVAAVGGLGLLPTLVLDPGNNGCTECRANLLLVHGDAQLETVLARAGIGAALAWTTLAVALLALRLMHASAALRRGAWAAIAAAALTISCFALELAVSLRRGFLSTEHLDRQLWLGQQLGLLALAGAVAAGWLRTRHSRSRLAQDTIELASQPAIGGIRERLARTLRDPTLELAYPVGDPIAWVDSAGELLSDGDPAGRTTTHLRNARGDSLALLRHRFGTLDDPAVVDEIARASGLALAHERLQVEARVQLETLRASRIRIVHAADRERERLEHDLHDGAQQRLVSLAVKLRLAPPGVGLPTSPGFEEAQRELAAALAELRVIAHGLYPAVLTDQGLAAALEALSETAPVPIRLAAVSRDRFDPAVEAAAYFVVTEAVRTAPPTGVTVRVALKGAVLSLVVESGETSLDLTPLEDRVGALGGTIQPLVWSGGRTELVAELPCAS